LIVYSTPAANFIYSATGDGQFAQRFYRTVYRP
jgi:hypothetical protein